MLLLLLIVLGLAVAVSLAWLVTERFQTKQEPAMYAPYAIPDNAFVDPSMTRPPAPLYPPDVPPAPDAPALKPYVDANARSDAEVQDILDPVSDF